MSVIIKGESSAVKQKKKLKYLLDIQEHDEINENGKTQQ